VQTRATFNNVITFAKAAGSYRSLHSDKVHGKYVENLNLPSTFYLHGRFQVFTAEAVKKAVFWDI
jgi:hypothetical protein